MLIHCSLIIFTARPSLVQSSVVTPSCSWYKISCEGAAKFRPSPLIYPTTTLSSMLSAISAPSGSVTLLAILAHNNFSIVDTHVAP